MATPRTNQQYTPEQRQEYLDEFGRSGLTQVEFCRRAMLHPKTFSGWRRKHQVRFPKFAEVQVGAPVPEVAGKAAGFGSAAVLHLRDGVKLEVALAGETAWVGLGLMLKSLQGGDQ